MSLRTAQTAEARPASWISIDGCYGRETPIASPLGVFTILVGGPPSG